MLSIMLDPASPQHNHTMGCCYACQPLRVMLKKGAWVGPQANQTPLTCPYTINKFNLEYSKKIINKKYLFKSQHKNSYFSIT